MMSIITNMIESVLLEDDKNYDKDFADAVIAQDLSSMIELKNRGAKACQLITFKIKNKDIHTSLLHTLLHNDNGNNTIAKLTCVLQANAEINYVCKFFGSNLRNAYMYGNLEIILFFLNNDADPFIVEKSYFFGETESFFEFSLKNQEDCLIETIIKRFEKKSCVVLNKMLLESIDNEELAMYLMKHDANPFIKTNPETFFEKCLLKRKTYLAESIIMKYPRESNIIINDLLYNSINDESLAMFLIKNGAYPLFRNNTSFLQLCVENQRVNLINEIVNSKEGMSQYIHMSYASKNKSRMKDACEILLNKNFPSIFIENCSEELKFNGLDYQDFKKNTLS